MILTFDASALRPGDILHVRSNGFWPAAIRKGLSVRLDVDDPPIWGNHDALYLGDGEVGDCIPMTCRVTPLQDYERRANLAVSDPDHASVIVLRPTGSTAAQGARAATWWRAKVDGRLYDLTAYPLIIVRCLVGQHTSFCWIERIWFCTESCDGAWYEGAGMDVWRNRCPTPYTTEKRWREKLLTDITRVVVDVG